jgi:sulfur-oxidizing protein SoxY
MMDLSRRQMLGASAGLLAISSISIPFSAFASDADAKKAVMDFTGGAEPKDGLVSIDMPEIAENGNTVPVGISVDSPMTADNYVKSVFILADGNPSPEVAKFHFSPRSGVAEAVTRMRLAKTQNIIAVAAMSDGSVHSASTTVKVTIGGCGG